MYMAVPNSEEGKVETCYLDTTKSKKKKVRQEKSSHMGIDTHTHTPPRAIKQETEIKLTFHMSRTGKQSGGKSRAAELLTPPPLRGGAKEDPQNPGASRSWALS